MSIAPEKQTEILKVVAGLFNAAPGGNNLTEFANLVQGGMSVSQLADALAANPVFTLNVMGGAVTVDEQAAVLMNNFGLVADTSTTSAGSQALAYFKGQIGANVGFGKIVYDAVTFLAKTTAPEFAATKTLLDNKAAVSEAWSKAPNSSNDLSVLQNVLSAVPSDHALTPAEVQVIVDKNNSSTQTQVLTTGLDILNGTSGNDTFVADNTGTAKQLGLADQINGGAGIDTLKIYLAAGDTSTGQPTTLSEIETVYINSGAITAYTAAAGTKTLSIDSPVVNTAATYTLSGQDLILANHNVTANTTTTVAADATSTNTAQKITLNGETATGVGIINTIDISGTKITTLDIGDTGASSAITLTNTGAAITALTLSGDKAVTVTENAATAAAIKTVTVTNSAGVTLDTSAAAVAADFKFTGGAGNDTIKFANDALGTLTSGAQLVGGDGTGDKIVTVDTALTATETARINQATGFEILGLNGAGLNLDASTLTIKNFSIDTAALTQTISNMAAGSTTTLTAAPTSLTLTPAVGVTETAVVLGEATTAGLTVGTLVTTGITNVTLTSNGTAANAITTLTNTDNSAFTIKGAADLTLTLAAGTTAGSKIDASAFTGKGTFTGSTVIASNDIIIGGSGVDTINGLSGADILTGGAGADTFTFTSAAAANANGATFGTFDEIKDFVAGTDKLQFSTVDVVSGQQAAVQTAVTALAAGSTAAAIATAMATANTTSLGVSFAVFEGNTYALYETTGAGVGVVADDVFIKLTGVTTAPTFAVDVIA